MRAEIRRKLEAGKLTGADIGRLILLSVAAKASYERGRIESAKDDILSYDEEVELVKSIHTAEDAVDYDNYRDVAVFTDTLELMDSRAKADFDMAFFPIFTGLFGITQIEEAEERDDKKAMVINERFISEILSRTRGVDVDEELAAMSKEKTVEYISDFMAHIYEDLTALYSYRFVTEVICKACDITGLEYILTDMTPVLEKVNTINTLIGYIREMNQGNEEVQNLFQIIYPERLNIKSYPEIAEALFNSFAVEKFGLGYVNSVIRSTKRIFTLTYGTPEQQETLSNLLFKDVLKGDSNGSEGKN